LREPIELLKCESSALRAIKADSMNATDFAKRSVFEIGLFMGRMTLN
jgi:hypothetical protein